MRNLFTRFTAKYNIKVPETFLKEEIVRFIVEPRSERIIETPLVLGNIPEKKIKILDVGCRYSLLPIYLASIGHKVYGIDINPFHRKHPNFFFSQDDITAAHYEDSFFDMAISLSTIEHIGLGFYKDSLNQEGDKAAINEMKRVLKKGGILLLTVPFGKPIDTNWYRVYDKKRLIDLTIGFKIEKIQVFYKKNNYWIPGEINKVQKLDSTNIVSGVAFVKAIKE